jgi:CheY-like chemotaxis protein
MTQRVEPVDVLIAEDDDTLRHSYRLLLEAHGLACAEATTGGEAVELARQRRPRCVLLDLNLPDMDGFTVARTLRADPRTSAAHIHCVSGLSDAASRQQASRSGCELYLTKPVPAEVLLEAAGAPGPEEIGLLTCSSLTEAENLLDWLQNHGCTQLQISLKDDEVTVRCLCPSGYRLVRDQAGHVRFQPV